MVAPGNVFPTFEIERVGTAEVRLTPVMFPDMLERLGERMSVEEYGRRLAELPRDQVIARIKADPDAAAPSDPGPTIVHRMPATSELDVQQVLEAFQIIDPLRRPARLNAPQDDEGK